MTELGPAIKQHALELGFAAAGIAPAGPADGFAHLQAWLERGYAGSMRYMERQAEARRHPSSILSDVRTVVMVAMEKRERFEETLDPPVTVRMVMFKQRGISSPDLAATERAPPW